VALLEIIFIVYILQMYMCFKKRIGEAELFFWSVSFDSTVLVA
jgi:hypothetical protein